MAQRIAKGFKRTGYNITPDCIPGELMGFFGPICAKYLKSYWSDLGIDYDVMRSWSEKAVAEVLETGKQVTWQLAWMCRDRGTHLYNLDKDGGSDGWNASLKTFGSNWVRAEILLIAKPDISDPSKVSITYSATITNMPKKEVAR